MSKPRTSAAEGSAYEDDVLQAAEAWREFVRILDTRPIDEDPQITLSRLYNRSEAVLNAIAARKAAGIANDWDLDQEYIHGLTHACVERSMEQAIQAGADETRI